MSETIRRRRYRYDRIVIEAARILNPQFNDAVIFVTGAQIELLRNVTEYLRRRETYSVEYHMGYYLTPTALDHDALMAIVSDLEETLMGNPNTIWGYKATRMLWPDHTKSGAGDYTLSGTLCPAGEIWRMDAMYAWNNDTACSKIELVAEYAGFGEFLLAEKDNPGVGEYVRWEGSVTLEEDGRLRAKFYGCQDGDKLEYMARGNTMEVPE